MRCTTTARRPRRSLPALPPLRLPAYAPPPPVLLALATLSFAAIRHLFSAQLSIISSRIRSFRLPRPPPPAPRPRPLAELVTRLNSMRDRAIADIDAQQLAVIPPTQDEYLRLAPVQKRQLLANALANATLSYVPAQRPPPPLVKKKEVKRKVEVAQVSNLSKFLTMAENVNGRAAALGFILCLAREITEPGHPSLFEQVVDVVVPIAQKTPPFLVAVVDRLADLLT